MKQIKKLQLDELKQIYKAHIREDFPRNERRPYSSMEKMTSEGKYASYGYHDDDQLLAYACYILTEDGMYALLDYSREATSQVAVLARIFGGAERPVDVRLAPTGTECRSARVKCPEGI